MEDNIRTKLTERGCIIVKIDDADDAVKCAVTYICKCKRGETTKKWSVAKGISDCDECLSERKRSTSDEKTMIQKYGAENASQSAKVHISQHNFETLSYGGKEFKYQGFEHFAIKQLIDKLKIPTDKIKTCFELCNEEIMPMFKYTTADGKEHIYFPDIRVEKLDGRFTFIEVKSPSENYSENLDLKMQSIIGAGYEAVMWRFNKIGNLIENKKYN